jgi:GTPase
MRAGAVPWDRVLESLGKDTTTLPNERNGGHSTLMARTRQTVESEPSTSNDPVVPRGENPERVAVVGRYKDRSARLSAERSLDELAGLVEAAGGTVVLRVLQERDKPDPATYLGRGKIDALATACETLDVEAVVFDNELSPAQLHQIEARLDLRVIDRTQLILDIFARRARTREGKWQVELAQLEYLLPRLVGHGVSLSRLGGGIGTRGPGETKLETDRRRLRKRISAISKDIDLVRRRRSQLRERRRKSSVPTVALVGYTNAGKTTLFNLLTREAADASDALFVTLDPLVRRARLPDKRTLLISDTVGFIDRLPHALVAAFRATLEEVSSADLLLHVIDASHPEYERQMEAVRKVLAEVGAGDVPRLEVFNKTDLLHETERRRFESLPGALTISALRGDGREALLEALAFGLALDTRKVMFEFDRDDEADQRKIADLYRHARVLSHDAQDSRVRIEAEVPRRQIDRFGEGGNKKKKGTAGAR